MTLPDYISRLVVSSVLHHNTQLYGKTFLFDGNPETCWQSDPGASQWILMEFKEPLRITSIRIQFQGGFAAEEAILRLWTKETKDSASSYPFHPTNTNSLQSFDFIDTNACTNAAIIFKKATDLFGRIIVYQLDLSFA
ncbi:nuclear receptor 2C2 associated protein [Echinococcus multilocularis]|uniref:Nuclear receptor 2C2 associated protein n=1 Tax=Echinococcus multilocularis TaxID=6211 RepID=A0A068YAV3_ECHMU|nr:nuclear receptor 2C2 associated protein [Echinococcus multilocularis]